MAHWLQRYVNPRPTADQLIVPREAVEGATCPKCGSGDVARYPVSNEHGARMATKCQACLHTLKIERPLVEDNWPPFRPVTYDWKASPSERATRDALRAAGSGDKSVVS
jgi:predicted RNA-binding Zn-ribbon protein involved in translation (DUF1610 family)